MSKFWYNNVFFGSDDSRDIMYDDVSVYDKLKELESTGGSGGSSGGGTGVSASSSFTDFSDTLTLERSGCSRVLHFKGNVTLSKIILGTNDIPYRQTHASVIGIKSDGTNFLDVLNINTDGTVTSKFRDDQTESVEYYGVGTWIVAVTESNTPVLSSDNNIRYNAENDVVEIFKNGAWVPNPELGGTEVEVVDELPPVVDDDTFYIVNPDE